MNDRQQSAAWRPLLLGLMVLALHAGCSQSRDPLPKEQRTAIEQEIGIPLPPDVILLSVYDGKGHNVPDDFWYWVFYSPVGFDDALMVRHSRHSSRPSTRPELPQWQAQGDNHKLMRDVFQRYQDKEEVAEPTLRLNAFWVKGDYTFRGEYIKTDRGDYLKVRRLAKRERL